MERTRKPRYNESVFAGSHATGPATFDSPESAMPQFTPWWQTSLTAFRTRLRGVGWREVLSLTIAFIVLVCISGFIELADEMRDGDTQTFDERVLRSMRRPDAPGIPIGPPWLREAALDVTALGSPAILILVFFTVLGLMGLLRRYGMMVLISVATTAGLGVAMGMKYWFGRDRPHIVPHLREVTTPSFPSGHAMLSAVVYLTLGILLAQVVHRRAAKLYCLCVAALVTALVGLSRIYLGVHYPTDVLAGWMAGIAWALVCWSVAQLRIWRRRESSRPEHSTLIS